MSHRTGGTPPILRKLDLWISNPHHQVKGAQRQQARLLAYLTLAFGLVAWGGAAILALAGAMPWGILAGAGLFTMCYILSRAPWVMAGAYLLCFGLLGLLLAVAVTTPTLGPQVLIALLFPLLVSILVLRMRAVLALGALTLVVLGLLAGFQPGLARDNLLSLLVTVVITLLVIAAAISREVDLSRIRRETTDLARYSSMLETEVDQRNRDILAASEIGRLIAITRDMNTLLTQVVNQVTQSFDYYYAQVFLLDERGEYALLVKGMGAIGDELLAQRYRFAVGSRSVVGQSTAHAEPIIIEETDIDPLYRRHELLHRTRSQMVLPLRVGGRVIGALDVQSVKPDAFAQGDVPVFQTIADQLAVAVERIRLFERTQRDLKEIALLNRQLTGEAWSRYLDGRQAPVGYETSLDGVTPVLPGTEPETPASTLSLPLTVRGETIGVLDVSPRSGEPPDEEMKSMLEAVAERIAQALDSTRLSEQAQRNAEQEQILSRMSAALQATTDLDAILKVVAEESSRALGTRRGFVHLKLELGPEPDRGAH